MCIAKAFITEDGIEKPVMEEVTRLKVEDGKIIMSSLLGEQKQVEATIREIDFIHSKITLLKT